MMIYKDAPGIWKEYQEGRAYNEGIDLYDTVEKNENFYTGKQWEGVNAPDLEKPVLNFLKRVVSYLIATVVSDDVAASLTPQRQDPQGDLAAKALSSELMRIMEQAKLTSLNRDLVRNTAVDGDGCYYLYFDPEVEMGQEAKGDIRIELTDNTRILFGNPYQTEVQKQPYILLVQRNRLETVREEAKRRGVRDIDCIRPDSGEAMDREADGKLVTVLIKLWKDEKSGTIHFTRSTQDVLLQPETDTGYRLYPVAYWSWERVKNSYRGQAAITGLIPNQIFVNKLWAMAMEHQKKLAFPKLFYDATKIDQWTNKVGQAIKVRGNPNEAVAATFRAGDMSAQVLELVDRTIRYTKEFMGANDAALGSVRPDNTSAIIALQQANAVPLQLQKLGFYQFIEDAIRVMLEIMRVDFGSRYIFLPNEDGIKEEILYDFSKVDLDALQLRVDVGASAYWSQLTQMQTMDNLFAKGIITDAITYLEGVPDEYVKGKNQIIAKLKAKKAEEGMKGEAAQGGESVGEVPTLPDTAAY